MQTLIFDLDDTLTPESACVKDALLTCGRSIQGRFTIEPQALSEAVVRQATLLWQSAPSWPYCDRMGMSPWEGLTSDFPFFGEFDHDSDRAYLREWAPTYRQEAWRLGLEEQGIQSDDLAAELAERFRETRLAMHSPHDGVHDLLDTFAAQGYILAVLTNGPSDLQAQKLATSGLKRHFPPERTFISGEIGIGKPSLDLYRLVLERLSTEPRDAVMIGDNPKRDIDPALACGLHAIWMRNHRSDDLVAASVPRIDHLRELPAILEMLAVKNA